MCVVFCLFVCFAGREVLNLLADSSHYLFYFQVSKRRGKWQGTAVLMVTGAEQDQTGKFSVIDSP